MLVVMNIKDTF